MNGLLVFIGKSVVMSLDLFSYLCVCAQWCLTFCDPMDCSPPGSSVNGIFPGKNTGVGCHFLLQGIFPTQVSCVSGTGRQILYHCATWGVHYFLGIFLSKLHGSIWYILKVVEDHIIWSKHVVFEKANLSYVRGSMVQWQERGLRSKTNLRINLSSVKHKVFTIMSLFLNHL